MRTLDLAVISAWHRLASKASAILWYSCAVLFCLAPSYVHGQSAPSTQVTPNNQTGLVSYNMYAGDHENVNLATGDLNVQLPLVSLPGRDHHDLTVSLLYDSRIYELKANVDSFFGFTGYSWNAVDSGGWRLNLPFISKMQHCDQISGSFFDVYFSDFTVTLMDGTKHHFDNTAGHAYHQGACDGPITGHPPGQGGCATDLSLCLIAPDTGNAVVQFRDGSSLVFYNYLTQVNQIDSKDANGNVISYVPTSTGWSITDTVGRVVTVAVSAAALPTSITYPTSTGTQQTTFGYTTQTISPTFSSPAGLAVPSGQAPMLTSITLPTSHSYSMQYNNFGELTKIAYPAGGYTRYAYGAVQGWYQLNTNSGSGDVRVVTNSYFCANASGSCASSEERPTTYGATRQAGNTNNTAMTVTDALGNYTTHTFSDAGAISSGFVAGCDPASPRELTRSLYDSGGHLLRSVSTDYNTLDCGYGPARMFPIRRTTTLDDGKVTKTEWDYDTFGTAVVDNVIEERVFDYGNLSVPAAKHRFTYLKVNPVNGVDYQSTLFILNRKASEQIYDSHTGSDVLMVQTTYEYDSYTAGLSASGATKHDSAYGTGYTTRGNGTAVSHWRNTDGAWLTTRNQYDDAGNILSTADPLGHLTQFSYADNFTDGINRNGKAYATRITYPATGSVSHIERKQYFYNSGLPAASCGQNFPSASTCANSYNPPQADYAKYSYDAMNRPVQVTLGDGGGKTISYNDVPPLSSTTTAPITSTVNLITGATMDGLGRTVQTRLVSDPLSTVYTDTTYDALGRVATVSNPYRSTSDSTYGVTQYQYDALNRVTQVIKQDNSFSTVSYNSNCTTTTDEAGKQRKNCVDALGRMNEVDEPGDGSPGAVARGGLTITGTLQTKPVTGSTPGAGSVTVSGSEQSKAGSAATPGHVSITITGAEMMTTTDPCNNPDLPPGPSCPQTTYDSGSVTVTVNGHADSWSYGQGDTTVTLASGLAFAINGDPAAAVTASATGSVLTLTSKATGTAGNEPFSTSVMYDSADFSFPSFGTSPASGALTGGAAAGPLVYDHGTCTVTINGTPYSSTFGQGDTTSTIASGLASTITAGTLASATASGATISVTSKTSGASTNYSLSSSCSYDSANFTSASFTAGASGSTLIGGSNGSPAATDAGTVAMSLPGYSVTANYGNGTGQDSTAPAVAADLVGKIQALLPGSNPPFTIAASGANITINWSSVGAAGNVTVTTTSTTTQTAYFPNPSFAGCTIAANPQGCSTALSGGADAAPPSLNAPYVTLYAYDVLGNLLRVDQKGSAPSDSTKWRTRLFTYNSLSQLLMATNPESGPVTYLYDNDGNLLQKTSPAPNQTGTATQTISYCYEALHRVTGKAYSAQTCSNGLLPTGTAVASYFYDQATFNGLSIVNGIGRRTGMTDQAGSEAWSYEVMGRPAADKRTIGGVSKTTSYLYSLMGSPTSIAYPSTRAITYTYNAAGQAISAADAPNSINYATLAGYSPGGALASLKNGTNLTSTFYYNKRLQPCRFFASTGTVIPTNCADLGTVGNIMDFTYGFNLAAGDNGNVISIANNRDSARSQSFAYDSLNRIGAAQTTATSGTKCFGESFAYDAWGNLLTIGGVTGYSSCTQENLGVAANEKNQISTNAYDAPGNMIVGGYTYDAENHLLAAGGLTYTYDGDGKRVKKSSGKLYWYGMGANVLDETDLAGNTNNSTFNEYAFFGGRRIARRNSSNTVFYYFADHLGTSRVIVQAGQTSACYDADFYPFGGERPIANSCPQNYKFTGKERDSESGLDDSVFRFYGSGMGRFLSPDPSNFGAISEAPQTWNGYSYVNNNPLNATDPNGLDCIYINEQNDSVAVKTGDCVSEKDNGIFVDGTVDPSSLNYNSSTATFSYNYTNDDNHKFGKGVIGDVHFAGPDPCDATCQGVFHSQQAQAIWGVSSRVTERYIGIPLVIFLSLAVPGGLEAPGPEIAGAARASTVKIIFKHGARHLKGSGLEQVAVENAIRAQIEGIVAGSAASGEFWGVVVVDGQQVFFRAFTLADGTISVGTYTVGAP